jgi:hypothetical protein
VQRLDLTRQRKNKDSKNDRHDGKVDRRSLAVDVPDRYRWNERGRTQIPCRKQEKAGRHYAGIGVAVQGKEGGMQWGSSGPVHV